jgi:hypothetical protein
LLWLFWTWIGGGVFLNICLGWCGVKPQSSQVAGITAMSHQYLADHFLLKHLEQLHFYLF